ncbi:membrane alanyl aminopeptidase-like, partial [Drosophila navojoa]
ELFQQPYQELGNDVLQYATTPRLSQVSANNWGLVIAKDNVFLEQPGVTDGWSDKELTIRNIAQENSHMWFGNSITCLWWSHIWLHEGFARYYEYFLGHQLYPDYQLDQQFLVQTLHEALLFDSQNITQPMTSAQVNINTPGDINYKFERIAFAKAASVIRMWSILMGEENFKTAIRNFLREYRLSTVTPPMLYVHLTENWPKEQHVTLNALYYDFNIKVGYPRIIVSLDEDNQTFRFEQKRFLLNSTDGSNPNLRYTTPISWTTNLGRNFQNLTPNFYFESHETFYRGRMNKPFDWIIVNIKQAFYYRVHYQPPLLGRIQKALTKADHSEIPVENRAAIIDDLFNFALAELIDYVEVFEFMEYMSTET